MSWRLRIYTLAVLFTAVSSAVAQTHHALIEEFGAAFNAHEPAKMASMVTDDFQLYYVSADGTSALATEGPEALQREMTQYFQGIPTVKSKLDQKNEVGNYISFRETASWTTGQGEQRSQTSLAVYQVKGQKIQRVWYYPAQ